MQRFFHCKVSHCSSRASARLRAGDVSSDEVHSVPYVLDAEVPDLEHTVLSLAM